MDIASLMASFKTGNYAVTRRGAATTSRGVQQPGAQSVFTIAATVVPANGRDLERLPEGRYDNETRVLFTTTRLYVGGQGESQQADRVTVESEVWEVQHVETWLDAGPGQTGYRCLIQRP